MMRFRRLGRAEGPMDCKEVARVLQVYLDGGLDRVPTHRLEAHLAECRRCGLEAETYRSIRDALAERRRPLPAESLERLRAFGLQLAHGDDPLPG